MFSIILRTARSILNSVVCALHFSDNFISVFNDKTAKHFCVLAVYHLKKEQIQYLEYSLLITKIHYIAYRF